MLNYLAHHFLCGVREPEKHRQKSPKIPQKFFSDFEIEGKHDGLSARAAREVWRLVRISSGQNLKIVWSLMDLGSGRYGGWGEITRRMRVAISKIFLSSQAH